MSDSLRDLAQVFERVLTFTLTMAVFGAALGAFFGVLTIWVYFIGLFLGLPLGLAAGAWFARKLTLADASFLFGLNVCIWVAVCLWIRGSVEIEQFWRIAVGGFMIPVTAFLLLWACERLPRMLKSVVGGLLSASAFGYVVVAFLIRIYSV